MAMTSPNVTRLSKVAIEETYLAEIITGLSISTDSQYFSIHKLFEPMVRFDKNSPPIPTATPIPSRGEKYLGNFQENFVFLWKFRGFFGFDHN